MNTKQMSKYKYWNTKKLKDLLNKIHLGNKDKGYGANVGGRASTKDIHFEIEIEDLLWQREKREKGIEDFDIHLRCAAYPYCDINPTMCCYEYNCI
jgi:hypothetical protein|tara:strand:+ start:296 stop:583 length:288 start_codon:yes stop_codon:yes gene_type:complete